MSTEVLPVSRWGEFYVEFTWHNGNGQFVKGCPREAEARLVVEPHREPKDLARILDCTYDMTLEQYFEAKSTRMRTLSYEATLTWGELCDLLKRAKVGTKRGVGFEG